MTGEAGRHLSVAILLDHVSKGITTVYPFPGEPRVSLLIDGASPRLALRASTDELARMPAVPLKNVKLTSVYAEAGPALEVSISGPELIVDGHAMLCAVADRIQLDGKQPVEAISETLAAWRSVLALRNRMSHEAEIGLVGELMFLEGLFSVMGATALDAWRGSLAEEHDFGLESVDVEVKTTSHERREHWIGTLTQLLPTAARELVVVSVQITRGGHAGRTMPEVIEALRPGFPSDSFDAKLSRAGWSDDTAELFVDRWQLRAAPRAFVVDAAFPALTRSVLAEAARDMSALREAQYKLDLHDRKPSTLTPSDLTHALQSLGNQFEAAS